MIIELLAVIDGEGVYGTFLTYALTASFAGSAFMMFIYLWWKGRLDMDEEPKLEMMRADQGDGENDNA